MRIISWNVNGLRAVLKKNFGDFVKEYSPDILCLQETKISYDICGEISLPFEYNNFSCAEKKGIQASRFYQMKSRLMSGLLRWRGIRKRAGFCARILANLI